MFTYVIKLVIVRHKQVPEGDGEGEYVAIEHGRDISVKYSQVSLIVIDKAMALEAAKLAANYNSLILVFQN